MGDGRWANATTESVRKNQPTPVQFKVGLQRCLANAAMRGYGANINIVSATLARQLLGTPAAYHD